MQTDSRRRRLRTAPPQPTDDRISLTADDLALFAAINRHGPLPSNFLQEFCGSRNANAFQHRFTKLYNGSRLTPPLLSRPPQQFQCFAARYQPLVYGLTKLSESLLTEHGTAITDRTDPFVHRLMAACFGASTELACGSRGIRYIPRAEILAKRSTTLAISAGAKKLVPDDLFGLRYNDGSYRFFAVEIDRHTERINGDVPNSFTQKLISYAAVVSDNSYQTYWGIPNLLVLVLTTNDAHKQNLVARTAAFGGSLCSRVLFRTEPAFGINWRIPDPSDDYIAQPWTRAAGDFRIDRP